MDEIIVLDVKCKFDEIEDVTHPISRKFKTEKLQTFCL